MDILIKHLIGRALTGMVLVVAVTGCAASDEVSSASKSTVDRLIVSLPLAIHGYNYTNRYIGYFKVDSVGGGNIYVSGPDSGGGGTTCCASYIKGAGPWRAKVNWQTGACRWAERVQKSGETVFELHKYYKTVEVDVEPNIPADPKHLEMHFYPDGTIQIALTEEESPPRLVLSKDREDKSPYPQCPGNEEPARVW